MNNLLFEKIWEDADFYQIIVKALAKNISAETKVYVTKENIIALSESIKNLINKHHSEFYWEIGDIIVYLSDGADSVFQRQR